MPKNNEIEKLVEILQSQTKTYSSKQIKSAIMAEGYSEEVANAVVEKLYPTKQQEDLLNKQKDFIQANETNKTKMKDTTEEEEESHKPHRYNRGIEKKPEEIIEERDHFKDVNYLIGELKNLGDIKSPEINTPELFNKEDNTAGEISVVKKENIETQITKLKEEIAKIKITVEDEEKVQTDKGKIINLKDYPRRDWHIYKDKGKTIAEIKEEQINKLRDQITELRKSSRGGQREEQKETGSERMREKYKEREAEREYTSTAAENIYTQMKKNPNIYDEEIDKTKGKEANETEEVQEVKKIEKKKIKEELQEPETEFNLDSETQDINSVDLNSNLEEEFNLNLNLDETPVKGKDKKKK